MMKLFGGVGKVHARRSQIIGLALTISTISYGAVAQPKESKIPQPPPELSFLGYFEGTWRCQQPAGSDSPAGIFTWTVRRDLNGFWYVGNAEGIQSSNEEKPINSREFLGYNAASQKLVRSVVVGNGNSYNLTASNWRNGKLVWEGTIIRGGKSTPLREEIIQDGQDEFNATYFIPDDAGKWTPVVAEICDRTKSYRK